MTFFIIGSEKDLQPWAARARQSRKDRLVKVGNLKVEAASPKEFDGMLKSARRGLADAHANIWVFEGVPGFPRVILSTHFW
jgi:hypothetical protein